MRLQKWQSTLSAPIKKTENKGNVATWDWEINRNKQTKKKKNRAHT